MDTQCGVNGMLMGWVEESAAWYRLRVMRFGDLTAEVRLVGGEWHWKVRVAYAGLDATRASGFEPTSDEARSRAVVAVRDVIGEIMAEATSALVRT